MVTYLLLLFYHHESLRAHSMAFYLHCAKISMVYSEMFAWNLSYTVREYPKLLLAYEMLVVDLPIVPVIAEKNLISLMLKQKKSLSIKKQLGIAC